MSRDGQAKVEAFKSQVQGKIQSLLTEFADGKLSREQFHAIYEHYSSQLTMAEQALRSDDSGSVKLKGGETIGIRQAYTAKAIGLVIYHNKSGVLLDTLGEFDIPSANISPVLNDFSQMMQANELIDRRVEQVSPNQWLLFAAGKYTTVVTQFHNEPSYHQSREIERLHHDFEVANEAFLSSGRGDASKLAYPFLVFVQQKITRGRN
jgi:hypothetical protein